MAHRHGPLDVVCRISLELDVKGRYSQSKGRAGDNHPRTRKSCSGRRRSARIPSRTKAPFGAQHVNRGLGPPRPTLASRVRTFLGRLTILILALAVIRAIGQEIALETDFSAQAFPQVAELLTYLLGL
jgi:hypothetical protein